MENFPEMVNEIEIFPIFGKLLSYGFHMEIIGENVEKCYRS